MKKRMGITCRALLLAACSIGTMLPGEAFAQTVAYNIASRDLSSALTELARQANREIYFAADVTRPFTAPALRGRMSVEEALARLLAGTGLEHRITESGGIVIERASGEADAGSAAANLERAEITVTGTRIRGAGTASPTVQVTRKQIEEGGFNDLGEVARSIPQNYNGGQNPGVTLGAGGTVNQNTTGASAINLRGLGPDATLTLLNGRRMAYGGFNQSIDVSAIPLGAVERLEIITDGGSALYGSDAVAGVANIITRRDFDGVELLGRIGGATDGGLGERVGSITAGTTWVGGGALLAYEYRDIDPVVAPDRPYLDSLYPESFIYPASRSHVSFAQLRQQIGARVSVSIDGVFLDRKRHMQFQSQTMLTRSDGHNQSYTIAPSIRIEAPADWMVTLSGSYSKDDSSARGSNYSPTGELLRTSITCYCNGALNIEASGEGPLFRLPAGEMRLAAGGGYRRNDIGRAGAADAAVQDLSSRYGFAELYVPILAPELDVPGAYRLTLTGAVRHENYHQLGKVTTPKLGLVYEPIAGLKLKGSWGRAFKAPTLSQLYAATYAVLYPSYSFGAIGYPEDAAVLAILGGGGRLRPERATSRTVTLEFAPTAVPGLTIEAGYFDIDYVDRVVQPLGSLSRAFIDPAYRQFLTLDPSAAAQAEIIARAPDGLINYAGGAYDPAKVIAIANNGYTNVARQSVQGIDLSGNYRFGLAGGEALLTASASWLDGDRQNSPGVPIQRTVGYVYNPAEFRARGGISWRQGGTMLAAFVNHVGAVIDNQRIVEVPGKPFTTVDTTLRYSFGEQASLLSDLELVLAVTNFTNERPPRIAPPFVDMYGFDSTNYSAIGRTISVSIRKTW